MVGISKVSTMRFGRKSLKLKKEITRWAPHLPNEDQKCMDVSTMRKLLKRFPRYYQIIFMTVVHAVGNEPWIHCFEPHQKIRNRV